MASSIQDEVIFWYELLYFVRSTIFADFVAKVFGINPK